MLLLLLTYVSYILIVHSSTRYPSTFQIYFFTKTWLPPLGCQTSPSQGAATGQKT